MMAVPSSALTFLIVFGLLFNVSSSETCGDIRAPGDGKVTCSQDNTLTVCTAVCSTGYEFSTFTQVERRYCVKSTGQWVNGNSLPPCIPFVQNMCKSIEPPTHGVVRCENVDSQLICNAKCNAGYMFVSQQLEVQRSCDTNSGLWVNGREFPNCVRNETRCSFPVAPANGIVNCDKNVSTVHCVALCHSGYEFSTGERYVERICDLHNGSWSAGNGNYPNCLIKKTLGGPKCSNLTAQKNTKIDCKHNGVDLICTASCDPGYSFETNDVAVIRVCDDATGTWLNGQGVPRCVSPCNKYIISGNSNITRSAFTASSIYNTAQLISRPERVRIDTVTQNTSQGILLSGGWRPSVDNLNQFIQIDFGREMEFYGIVTRGLYGSDNYVKRFRVLYSSDGRHFVPYGDDKVQDRFFEGNSDDSSVVTNKFSCPFDARYVRVNPLEWNEHIGIRLDLLGCRSHGGNPVTTSTIGTTPQSAHGTTMSNTASALPTTGPTPRCQPLLPPVNGIVNCEQSNKQLICSALCKDGFAFETGQTIIKRSCDSNTGNWITGTSYPDCRVYKVSRTTMSPINKLPTASFADKCVGRVADCKLLPNGDFQTCGDCHFYASCSEGYVYVRPCPVNLVFDSVAQRCLYYSNTCMHKPTIVG